MRWCMRCMQGLRLAKSKSSPPTAFWQGATPACSAWPSSRVICCCVGGQAQHCASPCGLRSTLNSPLQTMHAAPHAPRRLHAQALLVYDGSASSPAPEAGGVVGEALARWSKVRRGVSRACVASWVAKGAAHLVAWRSAAAIQSTVAWCPVWQEQRAMPRGVAWRADWARMPLVCRCLPPAGLLPLPMFTAASLT